MIKKVNYGDYKINHSTDLSMILTA